MPRITIDCVDDFEAWSTIHKALSQLDGIPPGGVQPYSGRFHAYLHHLGIEWEVNSWVSRFHFESGEHLTAFLLQYS